MHSFNSSVYIVTVKKPLNDKISQNMRQISALSGPLAVTIAMHEYSSTCKDVTDNHWPIFPSRSIPCPNECGKYPLRKDVETHLANECPLAVCSAMPVVKLRPLDRQDIMAAHSLALHMSLQATSHQQELEKLNTRISQLEMQLDKATELQNQSTAQITKLR